MLAVGANGVGKTNLLEAIHVATQGFSPRTRTDSQVVRFGAEGARAAVTGRRGEVGLELEVTMRRGEGKRAKLNGAPLRAAEQLRTIVSTLVFTPDRLGVVKGAPAARRAYFDRVLGRFAPARATLPTEYGAAVAQRNAALRRVAVGASSRDAVEPWSERVATLGAELVAARVETLALLEPSFAERAAELGLGEVSLRYDGEPPTPEALAAVLDRDLERGVTSLGPHLDDVVDRRRPTAICAASARRESSGSLCWLCSSPRRRRSRTARASRRSSCSTTCSRSSIPTAAGSSRPACGAPARRSSPRPTRRCCRPIPTSCSR